MPLLKQSHWKSNQAKTLNKIPPLALTLLLAMSVGSIADAQIPPTLPGRAVNVPEPLPRPPEPPSIQPSLAPNPTALPSPDQLLPKSPTSPSNEVPDQSSKIVVAQRFKVVGSSVFSAEDFAKVTDSYLHRPLSLADLFQVRSAITQLYLDHGYITSGAFLPPQTLTDGVVEIRVVEGELEDIKVSGLQRLNPNYVRSRIATRTGKPLNRERLLEALQLLQINPLIRTVSGELMAGSSPGANLLEVTVTEANPLNVQISLDNGRTPTVGTDRRQIQFTHNNLLGQGDRLALSYSNTNGSNTGDLSYSIPVNPRDGTLAFNAGISGSRVIEKPFDVLDIHAKSRYYELTFRQPIVQKPSREIAIGVTATRRESAATLLNGEIPFPALGADENGETRIHALRFFQEATWRSNVEAIALRSQFSAGLNIFDSTHNTSGPNSEFFSWRGQAQWVRLLAPETLLLLRGDIQLADRAIVPLEQFALGGIDTVRGYRQDFLLTDNGAFGSAELRVPILRLPKINSLLQVAPFIELGRGWNSGGNSQTLASVGLGLRLQVSDRLTARVDWGIPLISVSQEKNTLQENGVYFSVIYSPF